MIVGKKAYSVLATIRQGIKNDTAIIINAPIGICGLATFGILRTALIVTSQEGYLDLEKVP